MHAKVLDGRILAAEVKTSISQAIALRVKRDMSTPGLAVILVGNNPASQSYVAHKQRACEEVGILFHCHHLPADVSQHDLATIIDECNNDPTIHGILLQLPLPIHLQENTLLMRILPEKDVDGFHPLNIGRLALRSPLLRPCTPYGVMKLLAMTKKDITGLHAVVVGASNIVGRPMALELLLAKCTVTVCHRFTTHLALHVQTADILISAIGKPGVIQSDWIKPNAIVVDVGFSRLDNGQIVGDIEFSTASQRAEWITPVPGGVGQMTVATLLENTLLAAEMAEQGKSIAESHQFSY